MANTSVADPLQPSKNHDSTADPQGISNESLKPAVSIVTPGGIALMPTPAPKKKARNQ